MRANKIICIFCKYFWSEPKFTDFSTGQDTQKYCFYKVWLRPGIKFLPCTDLRRTKPILVAYGENALGETSPNLWKKIRSG